MSSKTKYVEDLRCERLEVGDGWIAKKLAPTAASEQTLLALDNDSNDGLFASANGPFNEIEFKISDDCMHVRGYLVTNGVGSGIAGDLQLNLTKLTSSVTFLQKLGSVGSFTATNAGGMVVGHVEGTATAGLFQFNGLQYAITGATTTPNVTLPFAGPGLFSFSKADPDELRFTATVPIKRVDA